MKSKRRKIFYVALSILIAATIWFYVNNKESVTVYVHDVPIEFLNEDTSLADKGLMRISGGRGYHRRFKAPDAAQRRLRL